MKTIAIYGDSISTGTHGEGGYENTLKNSLSLDKVYNFAVGSSGLTRKTPGGMLEVLDKNPVPEDAELFLIWHGSNDWYWGSELEAFSEAIEAAVDRLRAAVPTACLAWVTPIYRFECPDGMAQAGEAYELPNKSGYTMLDYYVELERASKRLGFPLIDMRRLCGIHRDNAELYLEDRVHPNRAGYQRISAVLAREIQRFCIF